MSGKGADTIGGARLALVIVTGMTALLGFAIMAVRSGNRQLEHERQIVAPSKANGPSPDAASPAQPKRSPCPVKLTHSRMVHNLEEDVYTTVTNVSDDDITAIALEAWHTDQFGDTWEPYRTNLTSEQLIRRGRSRSMHWEVLMETATGFRGKPGSSELSVAKVAFADGRVLTSLDIEGCSFSF